MKVKGSSGPTASIRSLSSPGSRPRPRSLTSSSVTAPSASPCITTTVSRHGSSSRTSATFSAWLASSQITTRDSESPATHPHSSGELVG